MVKRYIILANSSVGFETPRQLSVIGGERLIDRTIRLLRENGIEEIIVTASDSRFQDVDAKVYKPLGNDYDPEIKKSHWLKAFPEGYMDKPCVYLFGDVYYSENAIKTIIKEDNNNILFFCTYENKCPKYIKHHDEPLAFKVHNFERFRWHIYKLMEMWENDLTVRRPIAWELYRSINGQDVNEHVMTTNYIAINDESCDIDTLRDIEMLKIRLGGGNMIKVEAIENFTLEKFDELKNIVRHSGYDKYGFLNKGDTFECTKEMAEYLTGSNIKGKIVVKVIEVISEKQEAKIKEVAPKETIRRTNKSKKKHQ